MKSRIVVAVVLALLLFMPAASLSGLSSADVSAEDTPAFNEIMTDQIMSGIDEVTDAVSEDADSVLLPLGTASVLEAVINGETSEPQTSPVTTHIDYSSDKEIEELRLSGGAGITVKNGVTLTVDKLFIESAGTAISFSTEGTGVIIVKTLVIEGLVTPLPEIALRADDASIVSLYESEGETKSLSVTVPYIHELMVAAGDNAMIFSSDEPTEIGISAHVDLTDYKSHASAPGVLSTVERLLRYIGTLDLIEVSVDIKAGGSYTIDGYHMPFAVSDMELKIESHRDSGIPGYGIELSLGNVRTYPVDIKSMSISIELPASKIKDDSRPLMDRSREFTLTADSIAVERVEPDDPLNVRVGGLAINISAEPDPKISLALGRMAYMETVSDGKSTFDVGTTVSGFDMNFKGTASDLLDDTKGMLWRILTGHTIEGSISVGGIGYSRYDVKEHTMAEEASIAGFDLDMKLGIPQLNVHIDMDSFGYTDADSDISYPSIAYDLWAGIDTSFNPDSANNLRDLLKHLKIGSSATIIAEGDRHYTFIIDKNVAFMTMLSTDGLKVVCGNDEMTFDMVSVRGLASETGTEMHYSRLNQDEIDDKVPGNIREKLNGGAVVELSNSSGIKELDGKVEISVSTDFDKEKASAYYLKTDTRELEELECIAENGHVGFYAEKMGLYAASGPLKEPDRTTIAIVLLISAALLGVITVFIGKRILKEAD